MPTDGAAKQPSRINRIFQYFGLAYADDAAPLPGAPSRSRYGIYTSPRLDQDVDALEQRIANLEARLRSDAINPPNDPR